MSGEPCPMLDEDVPCPCSPGYRCRALAVYFAGRGNDDVREVHVGSSQRLPGVYPFGDYTVRVYLGRDRHRWTVNLRCHDGTYVVLAEYRWRWGALRFIRRSERLNR